MQSIVSENMSTPLSLRSLFLLAFGLFACVSAGTMRVGAQDAEDRVKLLIEELLAFEKTFENYSADILLEDRLVDLKGRVEFLKGSFIFVGDYRNRSSTLGPSTDWSPLEFGVFGNDSQTYYPESKRFRIMKDEPNHVPSKFPMNPALLFSQRHSSVGLITLLEMPGDASFRETDSPSKSAVLKRFSSLIASSGDRAIIHEIEFTKDASGHLVENSLRGGGRGNFKDILIWKQSADGLWYPHEQKFYDWPIGDTSADTTGKPDIYCRLDSLTTRLSDFQYLPGTVESRLPFATKMERYPSKFDLKGDGTVQTSYVGGAEGELQHNLNVIIDGFKDTLKVEDR